MSMKPDILLNADVLDRLAELQSALDAESLWKAFSELAQVVFAPLNDILFASQLLGFHPVFARTLSDYPRGEGYWARLVEIAGVTEVMTMAPGLPAARMSDHFDRSRERDERMYQEFMKPEGWAHCANLFFWDASGPPLGTLGMNRTAEQGDFSDEEMALIRVLQPHLQAAMARVVRLSKAGVEQAALRESLNALPVSIITLDDKMSLTFLNRSGKDALHRWKEGAKGARALKNEARLSDDLMKACGELLARWEQEIRDDTYIGQAIEVVLEHPEEAGFTAALRIVQPPNESVVPGYILTFKYPDTPHHAVERAMQLLATLTQAEKEVARLAANGHLNEDIAAELGISVHTVRAHLRNVFSKLSLDSRHRLTPLFQSLAESGLRV